MKRLKELRQKQKISQQKLAEHFHISQQSIWKYENGLAEPDICTLIQFADYFQTSVDYLIGHTDNPLPNTPTLSLSVSHEELTFHQLFHAAPKEVQDPIIALLKAYQHP
ncbi:MAG: helix-turn-helix domain-containing protein [Lachnospiraceae bacterium]|jgi:transcriptional regulator with XRE-family HTH domain|nr:helix-turn-helix domain-containing protein [Lachnospiraceae bacterium]